MDLILKLIKVNMNYVFESNPKKVNLAEEADYDKWVCILIHTTLLRRLFFRLMPHSFRLNVAIKLHTVMLSKATYSIFTSCSASNHWLLVPHTIEMKGESIQQIAIIKGL